MKPHERINKLELTVKDLAKRLSEVEAKQQPKTIQAQQKVEVKQSN